MTGTTLDLFDVPAGAPPSRRVYRSVTLFCAGRNGHDGTHNEDRVIAEDTRWGTLLAVVDGVTPRTPFTMDCPETGEKGVTSGRIGARIAEKHIRALAPGTGLPELVDAIHRDWQAVRARPGFPPAEIIGAVFAVLVPWAGAHGEVWAFGDCLWGYRTESPTGPWRDSLGGAQPLSSRDGLARAEAIHAHMRQLGVTAADIKHDPAVRGQLARHGRAVMDATRLAQGGESWLNQLERVRALIHPPVALPPDVRVLVLATDGFLEVPRAHDVGQELLRHLRDEDPLMLGANCLQLATAKGFVANDGEVYPYTDDVGIVVALA